jgi:hypothetical protein
MSAGVAGTFSHNVKQLAVWLREQLVEYNAADRKAVLAVRFRAQHLADAVGLAVYYCCRS